MRASADGAGVGAGVGAVAGPKATRDSAEKKDEADVAAEEAYLERAQKRMSASRRRLTGALMASGTILLVCGAFAFFQQVSTDCDSAAMDVYSEQRYTLAFIYLTILMPIGVALMLLSLLPGDRVRIREVTRLYSLVLPSAGAAYSIWRLVDLIVDSSRGGWVTHKGWSLFRLFQLFVGVALIFAGLCVRRTLRTRPGTPSDAEVWAEVKSKARSELAWLPVGIGTAGNARLLAAWCYVCRPLPVALEKRAPHRLAVSPFAALEHTWLILRVSFAAIGALDVLGAVVAALLNPSTEEKCGLKIAWIVTGCMWILIAAVTLRRTRRACRALLRKLLTSARDREAADVASLIGGDEEAGALLCRARAEYRGILYSALTVDDLASNRGGDLYARTTACDFREVDAFVSHSWSDDHREKWRALSEWADAFHARNGRPPMLWLDKACISQSNIATNLPCLPIWVAASRKLVVMLGESFISRLWCAMELYTFVRMGGSRERITVLVAGGRSHADALDLIGRFDVEAAQCTLESDREHLLSVVEAAFVSRAEFNQIVRHILTQALKQQSLLAIQEPMQQSRDSLLSHRHTL